MKRYKVLLSLFCIVVFVFLAVGSTGNDEEAVDVPEEEPEEEVSEIEEFREDILWNQDEIGYELTGLGEHFQDYDGSEEWYNLTELIIEDIRWFIDDAEENIDPPSEKQEHYDLYMEAMQPLRESMNLIEEWMETGDDAKLDEAVEYMEMGEEKIIKFQEMMDE